MSKPEQKYEDLRTLLKRRGPMSATEIIQNLEGLTQPTLWRWLSALPDVLAIGEGRSRVYGIARSEMSYPIVKVTEAADIQAVGEIRLLAPKGAAFLPEKTSHLKAEVFEDVPYFIWDMRPQGYLGKIFVSQHPELKLPQHWEDWREQDLYRTLGVRGNDLVGNLVVGNQSFEQFQSQEQLLLPESDRAEEYPKLASATLQGAHVGSSAGGEQPKFTAAIQAGKNIRHVIVKFSPPVADKAGRRWADLLFAENIALKLLNQSGYVAARSEAFESKGRAFIEVTRFDRVGRKGRRGILSLGAIDDEYVGERKTWTSTALKLHEQKLIKKHDADSITFLDSFGANIANSDRHFGNLSLFWELGSKSFELAPVYDMLPMFYAPAQGNVVEKEFKQPAAQYEQVHVWAEAKKLAIEFWRLLSLDERVSAEFQKIAAANMNTLHK